MLPAYTCAGSVSKPVTIILGWEIVARSEDPIRPPLPGLPWQSAYYRNLCRFLAADFVFAVPYLKGQRIITGQDVLSGGKRPGQLSSVEHRFVIQLCWHSPESR